MVIKCNNVDVLGIKYPLTKGKEYFVYGIIFDGTDISYEIVTNADDTYSIEVPARLFEILDNRLSQFFVLGTAYTKNQMNDPNALQIPFITFKEWANDKSFFERLVDGDAETQKIFNRYKYLLELEYDNPTISQAASNIGANWVQCPVCAEAWELAEPTLAMCKCVKCKTILKNPVVYEINRVS